MSDIFTPKREDGRSDWRVVYDILVKLEPTEQATHEELLLALETVDRSRLYRAVGRANRQLWMADSRSVANVKGIGYRVLRAGEHEVQAAGYKKRSRRQLGKAIAVVEATELGALTPAERVRQIDVRRAYRVMADALDQTMKRVANHEERIKALEGKTSPRVIEGEAE